MAKKTKKKTAKKASAKSGKKVAKKAAKKTAKKAAKKAIKKIAPKKAAKKKSVKAARPAAKRANRKPAPKVEKRVTTIHPYLTFAGNCEEAFNFYKSAFGGNFAYVGRFKEMPPSPDMPSAPETEGDKIMHISLPIGGGTMLYGSDSSDAFGHATVIGNNFSISVNAASHEEADKLYHALSEDGTKTMPMNATFWGSYFGMLVDKYGINWMISFDQNQNQ